MTALDKLKELALQREIDKHPTINPSYLTIRKYSDKSANGLTRCIIDFLNFSGHHAERINNMGRPIDNTKIVVNVLGQKRRIGSMKWGKGSGEKGTADISVTLKGGRSVKVEVKIGRDRQSPEQVRYQYNIEQAGGIYIIATSFEGFYKQYCLLV